MNRVFATRKKFDDWLDAMRDEQAKANHLSWELRRLKRQAVLIARKIKRREQRIAMAKHRIHVARYNGVMEMVFKGNTDD